MPYRFVHTADIHLDSPLKSLALRDPHIAALIGNATRRAFLNVVELCLAEQVDALMLAGDLYDGEQTSMKTAGFLAEQMRRLDAAGIRVFIIRGNHDALSRITRELTFPESVKLFGGRADALTVTPREGKCEVVIHGLSFAQPQAPDSLLPKYKAPVEGAINIALMHTSLGGAAGHDRYAPCSAAELDRAGFDYWALGHIHKRSVLQANCTIVMPGMPQGRDINEDGAKSVTLVTIMDDRTVHLEERLTSVAQFERLPVDVTGMQDWRDMARAFAGRLGALRGQSASECLVVRPRFFGIAKLAWRMRRDAELVGAQAADAAAAVGKCVIEAVEIDCMPPDEAAGAAPDPLVELRRLIREAVLTADSFRLEAAAIADELRGQLPVEARGFLGHDENAFDAAIDDIMREGADDVLARLHARTPGGPDDAPALS